MKKNNYLGMDNYKIRILYSAKCQFKKDDVKTCLLHKYWKN